MTGPRDVSRTDNSDPYSLYGDGEDGLTGEPLPTGSYDLQTTAYSEEDSGGDVLGTLAISFEVTGIVAQGQQDSPQNHAATGQPTISGTAQVGETLTADVSGIADADGRDNASFSYQWVREDGGTDTDIQGETSSTYTLTDDDEGKTVKVRVSFTDDAGNEETLTSATTAAVAARPNTPATGQPTIGGTAQVGETLTVNISDIDDQDDLENVTFSYQWQANDSDIPGATSSSYTLTDADLGKTVKVRVSFTDDAGNPETLTSAATDVVTEPPAEPLTATLENTPESHDGQTVFTFELRFSEDFGLSYVTLRDHAFTVTGGTVTGAGRLERPSNIRWEIHVQPDSESDVTVVLPITEDCNHQGAICTEDGEQLSNRLELTVSGPQSSDQNTPATGQPTIGGTVQVGETLTGGVSGIDDADRLENASFSYQWVREDGGTDTDIQGETSSTYTLTDSDEGKTVRVRVSFTDDAENPESRTSDATTAVAAKPNTPATGQPTIGGTVQVGETLTAGVSGIDDQDELNNATFSYQWVREDGGTETDIEGATDSTYTLTDDDEGNTVKVRVSFTDDAGNPESRTSDATTAVAARPNTPATGEPTIGGKAQVGETLTADVSDIADQDELENATFSYQWVREDGGTETDIEDATDSAYILVAADEGKAIKVRVSFTDDAGNPESLTSVATETVAAKPNTPATGQPTIGGTVQVGETLTADVSDIDDADGRDNAEFSYQWLADDAEIQGATDSTYTLVAADEGKAVKVRVTFTDDAGNQESRTSDATEAVAPTPNSEEETGDDGPIWSATLTTGARTVGYGYDSVFNDPPVGSLSPATFEIDRVAYTVTMIEAAHWMYIGLDKELQADFHFKLEVDGAELDSGDASFASYSYANVYRWEDARLVWDEGDTIEMRLFLGDGDSG